MPSSKEHREKAERNRAFLDAIDLATAPEWGAVVAFYSALHLVERLAALKNIHHSSHPDRAAFVRRSHKKIANEFLVLLDASYTARYGTAKQFRNAYPGDTVEAKLLAFLSKIEKYVGDHFPD